MLSDCRGDKSSGETGFPAEVKSSTIEYLVVLGLEGLPSCTIDSSIRLQHDN